jgi:hypothetical protein
MSQRPAPKARMDGRSPGPDQCRCPRRPSIAHTPLDSSTPVLSPREYHQFIAATVRQYCRAFAALSPIVTCDPRQRRTGQHQTVQEIRRRCYTYTASRSLANYSTPKERNYYMEKETNPEESRAWKQLFVRTYRNAQPYVW